MKDEELLSDLREIIHILDHLLFAMNFCSDAFKDLVRRYEGE